MSDIDDLEALESASFEGEMSLAPSQASQVSHAPLLEDSVATAWAPRALKGYGANFKTPPGPSKRIEALKRAQMELLVAVASGANDAALKQTLDGIRHEMTLRGQDLFSPRK